MRRTKLQILAEIRKLKENSNSYIETVIRADPYNLVADRMIEKLPDSEIFKGMVYKEIREFLKQPTMTYFYNSRMEPIKAFGEGTQELQAFYDTLSELFPGAVNVMEALNDRWNSNALYHEWPTPDGHISHVKVIEHVSGHLDNCGLDLPYRYSVNIPSKRGTSLPANYIHSFDAFPPRYIAVKMRELNADFSHVHDEYDCHVNHMSKVMKFVVEAIEIIASDRYLEKFCGKNFNIDHKEFIKGLSTSSYAIC